MNTINSRLRKVLPRIVMSEAKHVTKRISLILLVKKTKNFPTKEILAQNKGMHVFSSLFPLNINY